MNRYYRVALFFLAFVLAFSLAGCGTAADSTQKASEKKIEKTEKKQKKRRGILLKPKLLKQKQFQQEQIQVMSKMLLGVEILRILPNQLQQIHHLRRQLPIIKL